MSHTVAVVGNLNIDLVMGPLPQLPTWGHELVVPTMATRAAGAIGYTIMALDRLGLSSYTVSTLGADPWGDFIRNELAHYPLADLGGVETVADVPTCVSVALLNQDGQRCFVTYSGALDALDEDVVTRHKTVVLAAHYLLVCGYFFMPTLRGASMQRLFREARRHGVCVMLDTGWALDDWAPSTRREVLSLLPDVDIFLPNLDEAQAITGIHDPERSAQELLSYGVRAVVLKLGADGSLWADGRRLVRQPGRRVRALDTTGAGDSLNAALIYGLEQGWDIDRILAFANAFCSIVVSRLENRFPQPDDVMELLLSPERPTAPSQL